MASIKDIAKVAGVSISTVSYALNGSPKVTEQTRQRILAIAEELHYVPNAAARTLKTRKTHIIGAFLGDYSGSFYGELLKGINMELSNAGYELIVCSGPQSHRLLTEKMVDGAIVLGYAFSEEQITSFAERGHRMVLLDRSLSHENISSVLLDNKTGMEQAMTRLLESQPKRIHLLKGPNGSRDARERREVVCTFAKEAGIPVVEWEGSFSKVSGVEAAKKIIRDLYDQEAIVCLNDDMALGVYDVLQGTKFKIGKTVSLVGFDKLDITRYMHPRLASVAYSKYDWGRTVALALIELLRDGRRVEQIIPSHFEDDPSIVTR